MSRAVRILKGVFVIGTLVSVISSLRAANADEMTVPVPNVVIYPGDIVRDDMLTNEPFSEVQGAIGQIVEARSEVVGRVAKRTLLPGRAILWIAVGSAKAISNGNTVKVFFSQGGLTIVTQAAALEDGAVGDLIKVRNADSGLTISGIVQSDGSVRVGG